MIHPSTHKGDIVLQIQTLIMLLIILRQQFNNLQTKSETFNETKSCTTENMISNQI